MLMLVCFVSLVAVQLCDAGWWEHTFPSCVQQHQWEVHSHVSCNSWQRCQRQQMPQLRCFDVDYGCIACHLVASIGAVLRF